MPIQEMCVWSLGKENPLEKEMATHSSILAWNTAWNSCLILVTLYFWRSSHPFQSLDWLWQGKFYTSHLGQKLWTGQLSGTLGGLPDEVHGQSLMSESTDRLSLSFCHERTFRPKGFFSALLVLCWEESDRRKVKLFSFQMSLFSFLWCTRLMKPLAWIPSILKRNFHPWLSSMGSC